MGVFWELPLGFGKFWDRVYDYLCHMTDLVASRRRGRRGVIRWSINIFGLRNNAGPWATIFPWSPRRWPGVYTSFMESLHCMEYSNQPAETLSKTSVQPSTNSVRRTKFLKQKASGRPCFYFYIILYEIWSITVISISRVLSRKLNKGEASFTEHPMPLTTIPALVRTLEKAWKWGIWVMIRAHNSLIDSESLTGIAEYKPFSNSYTLDFVLGADPNNWKWRQLPSGTDWDPIFGSSRELSRVTGVRNLAHRQLTTEARPNGCLDHGFERQLLCTCR